MIEDYCVEYKIVHCTHQNEKIQLNNLQIIEIPTCNELIICKNKKPIHSTVVFLIYSK